MVLDEIRRRPGQAKLADSRIVFQPHFLWLNAQPKRRMNMSPHGLMFHHFHDDAKHAPIQGSFSESELEHVLCQYDPSRILSPEEWVERSRLGTLQEEHLCLTFDDALLSQFDIAVPVLEKLGLRAFFSIYSSPLVGITEKLELFRYIRNTQFGSMKDFYDTFFRVMKESDYDKAYQEGMRSYPEGYLSQYSFYSRDDRIYRYFRDEVLRPEQYEQVYLAIIDDLDLDVQHLHEILWMKDAHLKKLANDGHELSLHTHTHPTRIDAVSYERQLEEYETNLKILQPLTKRSIRSACHPCGRYNKDTLDILTKFGIEVGFRSNMDPRYGGNLEYPRIDSADLR